MSAGVGSSQLSRTGSDSASPRGCKCRKVGVNASNVLGPQTQVREVECMHPYPSHPLSTPLPPPWEQPRRSQSLRIILASIMVAPRRPISKQQAARTKLPSQAKHGNASLVFICHKMPGRQDIRRCVHRGIHNAAHSTATRSIRSPLLVWCRLSPRSGSLRIAWTHSDRSRPSSSSSCERIHRLRRNP